MLKYFFKHTVIIKYVVKCEFFVNDAKLFTNLIKKLNVSRSAYFTKKKTKQF